MVKLYTKWLTMAAEKTISISFRVSPRIKGVLGAAVVRKNRSLTNMLEPLVFAHCDYLGFKESVGKVKKPKGDIHA